MQAAAITAAIVDTALTHKLSECRLQAVAPLTLIANSLPLEVRLERITLGNHEFPLYFRTGSLRVQKNQEGKLINSGTSRNMVK